MKACDKSRKIPLYTYSLLSMWLIDPVLVDFLEIFQEKESDMIPKLVSWSQKSSRL